MEQPKKLHVKLKVLNHKFRGITNRMVSHKIIYCNNLVLHFSKADDGRFSQLPNSSQHFLLGIDPSDIKSRILRIRNFQPSDAGFYRCSVTNEKMIEFNVTEATAEIEVYGDGTDTNSKYTIITIFAFVFLAVLVAAGCLIFFYIRQRKNSINNSPNGAPPSYAVVYSGSVKN